MAAFDPEQRESGYDRIVLTIAEVCGMSEVHSVRGEVCGYAGTGVGGCRYVLCGHHFQKVA